MFEFCSTNFLALWIISITGTIIRTKSGPDLGAWPDCWVSVEFLNALIPRKGLGSTITMIRTTTVRLSLFLFSNTKRNKNTSKLLFVYLLLCVKSW